MDDRLPGFSDRGGGGYPFERVNYAVKNGSIKNAVGHVDHQIGSARYLKEDIKVRRGVGMIDILGFVTFHAVNVGERLNGSNAF